MTEEFRRLLDDAPDAELRAVLQSAERDQPSPRALTQAARTLGIGAAGLGLARAAAAAAGSRALRAGSWAALAKWGGAGILLGGIALSPLVLNTRASSLANVTQGNRPHSGNSTAKPQAASLQSKEQAVATVSAAAAPAGGAVSTTSASSIAPAVPAAASASQPVAAVRLGAAPAGSPARAASEPVSRAAVQLPLPSAHSFAAAPSEASDVSDASAPASAAPPHLLDNEIALLDSARAALKRGDSAAALKVLDRHTQLAAHSLGAEATLLHVQALLLAGRPSEARTVARAALSGKKDLPYAARLRKLAGLVE